MDISEFLTNSGDALVTGLVALLVIFITNKSNSDLQDRNLKNQWERKYFQTLVDDIVSYVDSILELLEILKNNSKNNYIDFNGEAGKRIEHLNLIHIKVNARVISLQDKIFTEIFNYFMDDFANVLDAYTAKDSVKLQAGIKKTMNQSSMVLNAIGYEYGKLDFAKRTRSN